MRLLYSSAKHSYPLTTNNQMKSKARKFIELVKEHFEQTNGFDFMVLLYESPFTGRTDINVTNPDGDMTDLFSFEINGNDISNVIIYGNNIGRHYTNIIRRKELWGIPVIKATQNSDSVMVFLAQGVIPGMDFADEDEVDFSNNKWLYTPERAIKAQEKISSSMNYMSEMIKAKTYIQQEIIPYTSDKEREDIRRGILNYMLVDKLNKIGAEYYKEVVDSSDEELYCISMAIGTIIKEYDWGTFHVSIQGICETANQLILKRYGRE